MRAVRFHEYGEPDVLQVDEVPSPNPARMKYWSTLRRPASIRSTRYFETVFDRYLYRW